MSRNGKQEDDLDGAPDRNPRPQPKRFPVKHERQQNGHGDTDDVERPQICDGADALPPHAAYDSRQHSIQAVEKELPFDERGIRFLERMSNKVVATLPLHLL